VKSHLLGRQIQQIEEKFIGNRTRGKPAALSRLRNFGIHCVSEPAREILAEQRLIQANGVPEKHADLFSILMLSRLIHNYYENDSMKETVVFDRGIPDMLAYARLFRLDETAYANAAQEFRFNTRVFYFPAWEEIYTKDLQRKMSFEEAKAFGDVVRSIHEQFGYRILEVPRSSLEERAQFILDNIANQ
jgi:predicted ATPase